jgi:ribonuclease D
MGHPDAAYGRSAVSALVSGSSGIKTGVAESAIAGEKLIEYICDYPHLVQVCKEIRNVKWLAVDTEFVWTKTYFPLLGIIQIAAEDRVFIIDYPAIDTWDVLRDIFADESVTKIFHDASQDVAIINYHLKVQTAGVFDTQLGAAMTGESESLSLEKLVYKYEGIRLSKTQTRTDWLARPLKEAQLHYAADDVRYLVSITQKIIAEAQKRGTREWLFSEMEKFNTCNLFSYENNVQRQFMKNANRVPPRFRDRLYRLICFIESTARKNNLSRTRVIRKQIIPGLIRSNPVTISDLSHKTGLSAKAADLYGRDIINYLSDENLCVPGEIAKSLSEGGAKNHEQKTLTAALFVFIESRAAKFGIAMNIVCSKSGCAKMVLNYFETGVIPAFGGWRGTLLNASVEKFFSGRAGITYLDKKGFDIISKRSDDV